MDTIVYFGERFEQALVDPLYANATLLGDGVRLLGASSGPGLDHHFDLTGSLIILIATLFLAFGMTSASVDSVRIARTIRLGPRRMRDLVGGDPEQG